MRRAIEPSVTCDDSRGRAPAVDEIAAFRRRARRTLVVLCLTAVGSPLFADLWYEHYQKGEQALNRKDWAEAIRQISQAIEKRSEPGAQVRTYGMNFINYHPYLKLGIAYYNMGQIDQALQAFDNEEQLGAIQKSAGDMQNLQTFRRLAREARAASEQERIARTVTSGLEEAATLERQAKLDDAMAAVAKVLAVDPKNGEANTIMERLRAAVARHQQEAEEQARFGRLVGEGKDLLSAGKLEEASSALQQAIALRPNDPQAQDLLRQSQERLRGTLTARAGPGEAHEGIATGLADAGRLERGGQVEEALQRLQAVLALEPKNAEALALQARLLKARGEAESQKARTEELARLLESGVNFFRNGAFQQSVASFSHVVALDPANVSARGYLARAYAGMNEAILSGRVAPTAVKLPPVVYIVRSNSAGGGQSAATATTTTTAQAPVQEVRSPDFLLAGLILDDQPRVNVTFERDEAGPGSGRGSRETSEATLEATSKVGDMYRFDFSRAYRLPPGTTALKVTARDADGLTGEDVHDVTYVRPVTESPWFYASLGVVGISATGALIGRRLYNRNRLLKRRFNPYVAGAPVLNENLFIGREALISRVLQTIHNNSILLYGERRIGKTSFQHHLKRRLERLKDPVYDFYPVFIDLQGTPQDRFFATLADDIWTQLAPVLDGLLARPAPPGGSPYDYPEFVRDAREVLAALNKRSARKVKLVLLIDEVDELNHYDPKINQRLRSLFMKSFAEDLVAVMSGVEIKKHWAREGSPWYNFFEELEVRPFAEADARELIERPIRGIFTLEKGVVERIIEYSGCKPYLIQRLCIALVNRMHDLRRRRIMIADVDAVGPPAEA